MEQPSPDPRPPCSDSGPVKPGGVRHELLAGAGYLHAGIRAFYREPALWPYAVWPMATVLVCYSLLMFLLVWQGIPFLTGLLPDPAAWSVWLRWIIYTARILIWLSTLAAAFLAGAFFLCTLYEAVGALFFDGLVMRYEKEHYGIEPRAVPFRKTLRFLWESIWYSLGTMMLNLLLLIPAFFIPFVGIVPAVLVVGYRFGITYLFSSAFSDGRGVRKVRLLAAQHRALMTGFGSVSYLWLLIPFSAVFLLPGFALGGAMLYHERLTNFDLHFPETACKVPQGALPGGDQ